MHHIYTNTREIVNYLKDAEKWLNDNNIHHFDVGEVFFLGNSNKNPRYGGYGLNHLPDRSLWENMENAIYLAEIARQKLGRIKISSAYRSPAYNKSVKGVKNSTHTKFNALDLKSLDVPQIELYRLLLAYRDSGKFKGGLGIYNSFIHLDTNGRNRNWDKRR